MAMSKTFHQLLDKCKMKFSLLMGHTALCDLDPAYPVCPSSPSAWGCSHQSYISKSQGLIPSPFTPETSSLEWTTSSVVVCISAFCLFSSLHLLHFITLELFSSFACLPISCLSLPTSRLWLWGKGPSLWSFAYQQYSEGTQYIFTEWRMDSVK